MQEQQVKVGVGLYIFNDKNEVLLKYRKGAHEEGTWCPPGGLVDFGETLQEAAAREAVEESALIIKPEDISIISVTEDIFKEAHKHHITVHLITKKFSGTVTNTEPHKCLEWKWFSLNNLPEPLFLPCQKFFKEFKL